MPSRHDLLRHPRGGQTNLYLVRHGRTDGNVLKQFIGSTDLPLDAHGMRQAEKIAERVERELRPHAIITSPLDRARTTARLIGERIGIAPVDRPGLAEMDFGDIEGLTVEELIVRYPDLAKRAQDIGDSDLAWPGGESRIGFHRRVLTSFLGIMEEWQSHDVVVVAHGGVISSFLAQVQGVSPNDWRAYQIYNCSLTHVRVATDFTDVELLNCIVHLEELGDRHQRSLIE